MAGPSSEPLAEAALDQLFREARSYNAWLDRDVSEDQIVAIYELMKLGPTSANQQPARLVWCKSDEAKARLASHAGEATSISASHPFLPRAPTFRSDGERAV